MKPQLKARILTGIIILSLITVITVMVKYFLFDSFVELERQQFRQNIERVSSSLANDMAFLEREASDWAAWDDSYSFMETRNPDFVRKNIPDNTFNNLGINLIMFVSTDGAIVYGARFDAGKGRSFPAPENLKPIVRPDGPLMKNRTRGSGVVVLPDGPMILAFSPIRDTAARKPARGLLIMGRAIGSDVLGRFSQVAQMPVSLHMVNDPDKPKEFNDLIPTGTGKDAKVTTLSDGSIAGYAMVRDIYGEPAFILSAGTTREIYKQGATAARYFTLFFTLAGLVSALIINILFDKLLLSRQKGKQSEERYQSVVKQATEGIVIVDSGEKRIMEGNDAFQKLLGYSPGEISGAFLSDFIIDDDTPSVEHTILRLMKENREMRLRRKDGSLLDVEISASFISHHENEAICLMVRDMTERKRFEERLIYEATHDMLTGLPNRNMLNDYLNRALAYDKRFKQTLALILLDLDNFKIVNDTLGHSSGDELLKEVAARLQHCVRKYDTVVRLGGDEFVIVLSGIRDGNDITIIADKILSIFAHPFQIMGHEMFITASAGIALAPVNGDKAETLLMNADTAMYHVKGSGRNSYEFFHEDMNARISARLEMETGLRRALDRREFSLHYQPKVNVSTGTIVGMESLLRWTPEPGRIIPPADFIPLLEETGLIIPVGEWVIREACTQNKTWQDSGMQNLVVSTNMSARQFYQKNLPDRVGKILEETGLEPRYLKIELTESIVMQDINEAISILTRLKEMGLSLSIDDFGTGYSSLAYLKRFPVDELKIDRSFVNGLGTDASDSTIVNTIISMAHSMNLTVVAEGVETSQQLALLIERNCEEVQGFIFSRPLTAVKFEDMIRNGIVPECISTDANLSQTALGDVARGEETLCNEPGG